MGLTTAHWVYLAGVLVIIGVTIARKNVLVPALLATAATAWALTGSPITAIEAIFNASLTAASELFDIFLIIALVTALLGALRAMHADQRMVVPFRRVMRGGWSAFLVLAAVTYVVSLFFWPTPAVPLIGAILVPAAIRAGLPAMGAGMAIAVAGQGMALSSDYVIQVAPGLSAKAAGVAPSRVADISLVLSLVTGLTALVVTAVLIRRRMRPAAAAHLGQWESGALAEARVTARSLRRTVLVPARWFRLDVAVTAPDDAAHDAPAEAVRHREPVAAVATGGRISETPPPLTGRPVGASTGPDRPDDPPAPAEDATEDAAEARRVARLSKIFAVVVPAVFVLLIAYLALGKLTSWVPPVASGAAAALVGGCAALLVLAAVVALDGPKKALTRCGDHVVDGLVFAFRAMGVVLPIAGFFFLGNAEYAGKILGLSAGQTGPGLLVDLVTAGERFIPHNPVVLCFSVLVVGMITGLEGSGFSGLPLTGSLAGALGPGVHVDPATLAALGQMGSVWTGGGVLVAWSSLLVVAGVCRVPVIDLARRCFLPAVSGLVLAAVVAALFF